MSFLNQLFSKKRNATAVSFWRSLSERGITLSSAGTGKPLASRDVAGYVAQLADDSLAIEIDDAVLIDWPSFYGALRLPGYTELPSALELPPFTGRRPSLVSKGALTDTDFSIAVSVWQSPTAPGQTLKLRGALLGDDEALELVRPEQWDLVHEVIGFARREEADRNDDTHRRAWGRIRQLALKADASLDDFLHRSVVLTPERLTIELRRSDPIAGDSVIEIAPTFEGAPSEWLEQFDKASQVQDRYSIATPEGIVQILVSPAIKDVLQEIKRLPLRRVAGSRAQAFILNPYAALGPSGSEAIDVDQFEEAREAAGLQYERFFPRVERDNTGRPTNVGVVVESTNATGPTTVETVWLDDAGLADFISKLETALAKDFPLLGWGGFDLELQGDAADHLATLKAALKDWRVPANVISYDAVHDLTHYSSRIEGIGIEKPYYSPYIAKKKEDDGWFPENVVPGIVYTPAGTNEPVMVPARPEALKELKTALGAAGEAGNSTVAVSWLPSPISVPEAECALKALSEVMDEVKNGTFSPDKSRQDFAERPKPKTLILRSNIQQLDYAENRRLALLALPATPALPLSLNPTYSMLPHQLDGLAWLQHLYELRVDFQVKGAVLADDMGLGKTLQLLTFMAWLVERDPDIDPMLVVAPLSLLENWREETEKFIQPGVLPTFTAYGDELSKHRVPKEQIDERLRIEDGLVRFLKPRWVGNAKLVLTTYETLRDLEFSFAAESWSVMVCDEAQRIKNPAAMVTRAAKKQKIGFKVACTGTPVENTLADLWCLFDFVQPGLLGALNDFGQRYRKPIEARSDEDRARTEELRAMIAPQILRRTKAEVAKDLPAKIIVDACRSLPLSNTQRDLYSKAIDAFKNRNVPGAAVPFKNHLGLLHYLRLVCTDPRQYWASGTKLLPLPEYREKAPKLEWLLSEFEGIRQRDEKAIIFCEFRNIQRLLQHYIEEVFGFRADIINGDTVATAKHTASRQARIKAFQQKPGFGVIILSPVAVGFGVNIQAANHVIHYTRTWNPAKEDQATDRAYRIGQTKDVYVYYPVVTAADFSTFDVKLDQLLERKRLLANDMLNGSGDLSPGDFDIVDVAPVDAKASLNERVDLPVALGLEWRYFEGLAAALWNRQGFPVCYCTPASGDHGVDAVAINGSDGVLLQTKTTSKDGAALGWDAISEVVAGVAHYERQHPSVSFRKVGLTNQFFNENAHHHAKLNNVELIDQRGLGELLERFPVSMLDIERILFPDWNQYPGAD